MKKYIFLLLSIVWLLGACQNDDAYLSIKTKEVTIDDVGGEANIAFETNSSWIASSSEPWCKITPSRGGQSSRSTTVKLAPNDTHTARTCQLTILAGDVSETITITQLQRDAIIISNTTYELLSGSQTLEVELQANVAVEVIIEEDAQGWVSTPHTRGLMVETVTLHIAENTSSDTQRTAKVYIKDRATDLQEVLTIVQQGKSTYPANVQVIEGDNSKIQHFTAGGDFVFRMGNLNNEDIYFVFTNDNEWQPMALPKLVNDERVMSKTATTRATSFSEPPFIVPGKPSVTEFNNNPPPFLRHKKSTDASHAIATRAASLTVGASEHLKDDEGKPHLSTVRKVVSAHGKNLYVWVANDCWHEGGTKSYQVTPRMVDALANKFLASGTDNDIYEWVTNAAGEHWGATDYDNLIADTDDIHSWLMDIYADDKTTGTVTGGYFFARDNYRKSSQSASNEKLLFTIDAVLFAKPDDGRVWSLSDYWPSQMISTLAHEFTHMIYFYQHEVLKGLHSNTAINEMSAQCVEDLVANKILADGPRGVPYAAASAGANRNARGRIPYFNSFNDYTLLNWSNNEDETLTNYAKTYALGAYLMRNYGGAHFIRELIQNRYSGTRSIVEAVNANGGAVANYGELLQRFGAAYLLSNKMDTGAGYLFNKGDVWSESTVNGITYELGSINFYNYFPTPFIHEVLPELQSAGSNLYFSGGSGISGEREWYFRGVSEGTKITVVVK